MRDVRNYMKLLGVYEIIRNYRTYKKLYDIYIYIYI